MLKNTISVTAIILIVSSFIKIQTNAQIGKCISIKNCILLTKPQQPKKPKLKPAYYFIIKDLNNRFYNYTSDYYFADYSANNAGKNYCKANYTNIDSGIINCIAVVQKDCARISCTTKK
jgi:hypothetical protein